MASFERSRRTTMVTGSAYEAHETVERVDSLRQEELFKRMVGLVAMVDVTTEGVDSVERNATSETRFDTSYRDEQDEPLSLDAFAREDKDLGGTLTRSLRRGRGSGDWAVRADTVSEKFEHQSGQASLSELKETTTNIGINTKARHSVRASLRKGSATYNVGVSATSTQDEFLGPQALTEVEKTHKVHAEVRRQKTGPDGSVETHVRRIKDPERAARFAEIVARRAAERITSGH